MPLKFAKIAYGGKISFIHNANDNQLYNNYVKNNDLGYNENQSNFFTYDENTQALYGNISKSIKKWDFQVGLRAEFTQAHGESTNIKYEPIERSYNKLFPSAFATYKASKEHVFNVSFNRRISRPSYWQLDPFTFVTKTLEVSGNPNLTPAYTNNFTLKHTYKGQYTTEFSFARTENQFGQITIPNTNTYKSIATNENYYNVSNFNFSETFTIKPKSFWESSNQVRAFYTNNTIFYAPYGANLGNGQDGFSGYFSTNNTFTANKSKTFTVFANFEQKLYGRDGYQKTDPSANLSLGLRYLALAKKLDLSLKGNDIFNQSIVRNYSNVNQIQTSGYYRPFARSISVTARYNFGSDKVRAKQRQDGNNEEKQRAGAGS